MLDPNKDVVLTATIAAGQTVSSEIDPTQFGFVHLTIISLPAAFTGTTIGLQRDVNGTYQPVAPSGTPVAYPAAASRSIGVPQADARFVQGAKFKIVSGSAEAADRIVTIILRYQG